MDSALLMVSQNPQTVPLGPVGLPLLRGRVRVGGKLPIYQELRGGVHRYAAQASLRVDTARA
jgi:hypothetical protein